MADRECDGFQDLLEVIRLFRARLDRDWARLHLRRLPLTAAFTLLRLLCIRSSGGPKCCRCRPVEQRHRHRMETTEARCKAVSPSRQLQMGRGQSINNTGTGAGTAAGRRGGEREDGGDGDFYRATAGGIGQRSDARLDKRLVCKRGDQLREVLASTLGPRKLVLRARFRDIPASHGRP